MIFKSLNYIRKFFIKLLGGCLKEDIKNNKEIYIKKLEENETEIVYLKKELELQQQMLFYIGDYFHNFGISSRSSTKNNLSLGGESCSKIGQLFLNIRNFNHFSSEHFYTKQLLKDVGFDNFRVETIIREMDCNNRLENKVLIGK